MKQTKAVNYISLCPHCNAIPSIRMIPKMKRFQVEITVIFHMKG